MGRLRVPPSAPPVPLSPCCQHRSVPNFLLLPLGSPHLRSPILGCSPPEVVPWSPSPQFPSFPVLVVPHTSALVSRSQSLLPNPRPRVPQFRVPKPHPSISSPQSLLPCPSIPLLAHRSQSLVLCSQTHFQVPDPQSFAPHPMSPSPISCPQSSLPCPHPRSHVPKPHSWPITHAMPLLPCPHSHVFKPHPRPSIPCPQTHFWVPHPPFLCPHPHSPSPRCRCPQPRPQCCPRPSAHLVPCLSFPIPTPPFNPQPPNVTILALAVPAHRVDLILGTALSTFPSLGTLLGWRTARWGQGQQEGG